MVHKNILCSSSAYLKKAVNGPWKESEDKHIVLLGTNPIAFEIYVAWLYTAQVQLSEEEEPAGKPSVNFRPNYEELISAYSFGDYAKDRRFCNALVDEMLAVNDKMRVLPSNTAVKQAYDTVPRGCGLRRLLVELFTYYHATSEFESMAHTYPPAFITDIAKLLMKERYLQPGSRVPTLKAKCHYHDHVDEVDKCA